MRPKTGKHGPKQAKMEKQRANKGPQGPTIDRRIHLALKVSLLQSAIVRKSQGPKVPWSQSLVVTNSYFGPKVYGLKSARILKCHGPKIPWSQSTMVFKVPSFHVRSINKTVKITIPKSFTLEGHMPTQTKSVCKKISNKGKTTSRKDKLNIKLLLLTSKQLILISILYRSLIIHLKSIAIV